MKRLTAMIIGTLLSSSQLGLAQDAVESVAPVRAPQPLYQEESKALTELRLWTFDKWLSVRQTNHPLYHYALGAVKFRAFLHYCKRHDINVDMHPIETLANKNLVEILTAHYEEPEWAAFQGMDADAVRAFLADMARDIYSYEFANAVAEQKSAKEASGKINKFYCEGIARSTFQDYVALRATAKREIGR